MFHARGSAEAPHAARGWRPAAMSALACVCLLGPVASVQGKTITLQGRVFYGPQSDRRPVHYALVEVWDDYGVAAEASARADATGSFTLTYDNNDPRDVLGDRIIDPKIRLVCDSAACQVVVPGTNIPYAWTSPVIQQSLNSDRRDLELRVDTQSLWAPFASFSAISDSYFKLRGRLGHEPRSKVRVVWPVGGYVSDWWKSGTSFGTVRMSNQGGSYPDEAQHEYGHSLQQALYNYHSGFMPNPEDDFAEGWATFIAAWTDDDARTRFSIGASSLEDADFRSGRVLWDLVDSARSADETPGVDDDPISDESDQTFSKVWTVVAQDNPHDLRAFWNAWHARNTDARLRWKTKCVFVNNGATNCATNRPPQASTDQVRIGDRPVTAGAVYRGTLSVSAIVTDPDVSDRPFLRVYFFAEVRLGTRKYWLCIGASDADATGRASISWNTESWTPPYPVSWGGDITATAERRITSQSDVRLRVLACDGMPWDRPGGSIGAITANPGTRASDPSPAFTVDNTPLSLTDVVANPTHNSATISFTVSREVRWKMRWGTNPGNPEHETSEQDFGAPTRITLQGLNPQTEYHFSITATDRQGASAESGHCTFTTRAAPAPQDTVPPVLENVQVTPGPESATVTWTTGGEAATSTVKYGTSSAYGSTASAPGMATSHSVVLTNLTPDTLYHYQVVSRDAANNEARSADATFRTLALTGQVAGTVVRADNGAPIAGAQVQLRERPALRATTSGSGAFSIPGTPPGTYTLSVSAAGYAPAEQPVQVQANTGVARTVRLVGVGRIFGRTQCRVTTSSGRRGRSGGRSSSLEYLNGVLVTAAPGGRSDTSRRRQDPLGGHQSVPATYVLDNMPLGTYTLTAARDGYVSTTATVALVEPGQVAQQDFTMEAAAGGSNTGAPDDAGQPDLSVASEGITHSPAQPAGGQRVTITARVKNTGTSRARSVKVCLRLGEQSVAERTVPSFPAGATTAVALSWTIPGDASGNTLLQVMVDPDNSVAEADESNNAATHTLPIGAAPVDLVAAGITLRPSNPRAGTLLTIGLLVRNLSNASVSRVKVRFIVGGQVVGEKTLSSIGARRTAAADLPWRVPVGATGTVTVEASVDPDNAITETDENNNSASRQAMVSP